jgi:hypothetical protein
VEDRRENTNYEFWTVGGEDTRITRIPEGVFFSKLSRGMLSSCRWSSITHVTQRIDNKQRNRQDRLHNLGEEEMDQVVWTRNGVYAKATSRRKAQIGRWSHVHNILHPYSKQGWPCW